MDSKYASETGRKLVKYDMHAFISIAVHVSAGWKST